LNGQATALCRLDRYEEADGLYAQMRACWPNSAQGWTSAAQSAAWRKDWAGAEALWRDCLERFCGSATADLWAQLSNGLQRQGRTDEARVACRTAQERFPEDSAGWVAEARIANSRSEWPLSERLWRNCIARFNSSTPQWFEYLVRALQQQGRFVEAE